MLCLFVAHFCPFGEQGDLRRQLSWRKVLVFVTGAADVTIRDFLELFKRHIVRYGLDWTGLDLLKEGLDL